MLKEIPRIGFGTYKFDEKTAYESVLLALNLGFRHIDTARRYKNENAVGEAVKKSGINRKEIRLTTKLWPTHFNEKDCNQTIENSLKNLQTDYIDLLLLHWPDRKSNYQTHYIVGECIAKWIKKGAIRFFGVSNFSCEIVEKLNEFMKKNFNISLFANQIEYHPYLKQKNLKKCCEKNKILIEAYAPFAHGEIFKNQNLLEISKNFGYSLSQLIIKRLISEEIIPIFKSSKKEHIEELKLEKIEKIQLPIEFVEEINKLPKKRLFDKDGISPDRDD